MLDHERNVINHIILESWVKVKPQSKEAIILKWRITPRAQRQLIQEVIKEPRTTSKELKA